MRTNMECFLSLDSSTRGVLLRLNLRFDFERPPFSSSFDSELLVKKLIYRFPDKSLVAALQAMGSQADHWYLAYRRSSQGGGCLTCHERRLHVSEPGLSLWVAVKEGVDRWVSNVLRALVGIH